MKHLVGKVIKKKVKNIKELEINYWKCIEEQREKLFSIEPQFKTEFNK